MAGLSIEGMRRVQDTKCLATCSKAPLILLLGSSTGGAHANCLTTPDHRLAGVSSHACDERVRLPCGLCSWLRLPASASECEAPLSGLPGLGLAAQLPCWLRMQRLAGPQLLQLLACVACASAALELAAQLPCWLWMLRLDGPELLQLLACASAALGLAAQLPCWLRMQRQAEPQLLHLLACTSASASFRSLHDFSLAWTSYPASAESLAFCLSSCQLVLLLACRPCAAR